MSGKTPAQRGISMLAFARVATTLGVILIAAARIAATWAEPSAS